MLAIQTGIAITMRCPRFTISMHSFSNSSLAFVLSAGGAFGGLPDVYRVHEAVIVFFSFG